MNKTVKVRKTQESTKEELSLKDTPLESKKSLKDEFIPPPYPFNPPKPAIDYYIVDEMDQSIFGRYSSEEEAENEARRLVKTKHGQIIPVILEFDGQVIIDSEKNNKKYLQKILDHKKGPDLNLLMLLASALETALKKDK